MLSCSIIITSYNKKKLLLESFYSALHQIRQNDEIILVDDFSNDFESIKTLENISKLHANYNNLTIIKNLQNFGASASKDIGIRSANNEIIILLDADDILPDYTIETITKIFEKNPESDLVYGDYEYSDGIQITRIDCSKITSSNTIDTSKLIKNWILLGTSPFRKSSYIKYSGFDFNYPNFDDVDLHRKMLANGAKFTYTNSIIYTYRKSINSLNATQTRLEALFSNFRNINFYYVHLSNVRFILFLIFNSLKLIIYILISKKIYIKS